MHVQQYAFPSYGFSEPKNSLSYIYSGFEKRVLFYTLAYFELE